jgi:hypothetical protein
MTVDQELRRAATALGRTAVAEPDLEAASRRVRRRSTRTRVAALAAVVVVAGAIVSAAGDRVDREEAGDVVAGRDATDDVLAPVGRTTTGVRGDVVGLVALDDRLVALADSPLRYVVAGEPPENGALAWTSDDGGTSWLPHVIDPTPGTAVVGAAGDGSIAVAVVTDGDLSHPELVAEFRIGNLWTTTDGVTWARVQQFTHVAAVTWDGHGFLAYITDGTWWTSVDGQQWVPVERAGLQVTPHEAMRLGAGPWGAAATWRDGDGGAELVRSMRAGDASWTEPLPVGPSAEVVTIAVGDDIAILGGRGGDGPRMWTSTDGTAWIEHVLPGTGHVEAIVPTARGWAALADQPGTPGPVIYTSTDGATWEAGPGGFDAGDASTLVAQDDGVVALGTSLFRWSWTDSDDVATTTTTAPRRTTDPTPMPGTSAADLAAGIWYVGAPPPVPIGRDAAVAWTGDQLLVLWGFDPAGAIVGNGAAYSLAADAWEALPPAPISPRSYPTTVWTGRDWIVLGGVDADGPQRSGTAYQLLPRAWREIAPAPFVAATAIWDGERVVATDDRVAHVAWYDVDGDIWRGLPSPPQTAAAVVGPPELVWDGAQLTVWRTTSVDGTEAPATQGYLLGTDGWEELGPPSTTTATGVTATAGDLVARAGPRCAPSWGCPAPAPVGAVRFDPAVGWVASPTEGVAIDADPVWTGSALVVGGCCLSTPDAFGEMQPVAGSAWDPLADVWHPLPMPPMPLASPFVWLGDRVGSVGRDGILILLPAAAEVDDPLDGLPMCPVPDACSGIRRGGPATGTTTTTATPAIPTTTPSAPPASSG